MSDHLRITGIEAWGHHGVFAHERADGQRFVVDLDLVLDLGPAGGSDDPSPAGDSGQAPPRCVRQGRAGRRRFVGGRDLVRDLGPAGDSDDLSLTVDYGQLTQRVSDVVASDPVDLIETLAQRIARLCLGEPLVHHVTVTVHKPQAPAPVTLTDLAANIERGPPAPRLCRGAPLVPHVTVTVHKPQAPVPVKLTDVAVTIERSRP